MLLGRLARGFAAECEQRHAVPTEHPGSKFRLVVVFHQAVKDWAVRWRLKGGDEPTRGVDGGDWFTSTWGETSRDTRDPALRPLFGRGLCLASAGGRAPARVPTVRRICMELDLPPH